MAAVNPAEQGLFADAVEVERILHTAEKHYALARASLERARDEWSALAVRPSARPEQIQAARGRFEAVVARCRRLRAVIETLEDRLSG